MKYITSFFALLFFLSLSAQDEMNSSSSNDVEFNQLSFNFGIGVNKPTRFFTRNYSTPTFQNISTNLGVRYMFNERFGLRVHGIYNNFEDTDSSPEFNTHFTQINLDAVFNLRQVLDIKGFSDKFNLLATGGLGYGFSSFDDPALFQDQTDNVYTINGSLVPQYKITDKFALELNLGVSGLIGTNYSIDGNTTSAAQRGFDGANYTATLGFSIYLGDKKDHADWVDNSLETKHDKDVNDLNQQIADLEDKLKDDDEDGVPNYVDEEPNTPKDVLVNSKGETMDEDGNQIPDNMQKSLDKRYLTKTEVQKYIDVARILANKGYINVYFDFDKAEPLDYSLNTVTIVMEYMKANPNVKAKLVGYADERGSEKYNKQLSEERAKNVHDILVATGIDASRLSYSGEGEDKSVVRDADRAEDAMRISRRVKVQLMK